MSSILRFVAALALLAASLPSFGQVMQGSAFTYQGELRQNSQPVTASVEMVFSLYDAPTNGNQIGASQSFTNAGANPVAVVNGLFTVTLDFGDPAFLTVADDARWLAVTVNGNPLSPRTKIENAPYALTSLLAYNVLANSIGTTQVNATQVQRRVSGSCTGGTSISVINQDGTVSCQSAGSGTITGVTPANGSGLTGGGTSGGVSIGTDLTVLQKRVTGTCAAGSSISSVNSDGSVACQSAGGSSFTLPYSATQSYAGPLFNITDTDTSSASTALQGTSNSTAANVSAVEGVISSTSPGSFSAGVRGVNNSTTSNGFGVYGSTAGAGTGVNGTSASGAGVVGQSTSGYGIGGVSTSGAGVYGNSASGSSGVFVSNFSSADTLYVGTNNATATGIHSIAVNQGVLGTASGANGIGVQGQGFKGVQGVAPGSAAGGYGVAGYSLETTTANTWSPPNPPSGPAGVYGSAAAASGIGVSGVATSTDATKSNFGVVGQGGGQGGVGVAGFGQQFGMYGISPSATGIGVYGESTGYGVYGYSDGGVAVTAYNTNGLALQAFGSPAGTFSGQVGINQYPPNSAVELIVAGCCDASNPNADITLMPYSSSIGFNLSATSSRFSIQATNGANYPEVFAVDSSGNMSIAGANAYKPGGGSWAAPSDLRLKRNVDPLENVLDTLLQLRGVSFEYADPDSYLHPPGRHVGFIAQEVQQVFPDWVGHTPDGYLSVGPTGFEAMTVEALRELRAEKDAELAALKAEKDGEIAALHAAMSELVARLDRVEAKSAGQRP